MSYPLRAAIEYAEEHSHYPKHNYRTRYGDASYRARREWSVRENRGLARSSSGLALGSSVRTIVTYCRGVPNALHTVDGSVLDVIEVEGPLPNGNGELV